MCAVSSAFLLSISVAVSGIAGSLTACAGGCEAREEEVDAAVVRRGEGRGGRRARSWWPSWTSPYTRLVVGGGSHAFCVVLCRREDRGRSVWLIRCDDKSYRFVVASCVANEILCLEGVRRSMARSLAALSPPIGAWAAGCFDVQWLQSSEFSE